MKKAIWIEVLGEDPPLSSPASLAYCQEFVLKHGFTSLYLQVYRAGEAWAHCSSLFPDSPYQMHSQAHSEDLVAKLITWAKPHGIDVHLWCNIFHVGSGGVAAAHFRDTFGLEVFLEDGSGNKPPYDQTQALRIDAPGYWLDPASSELLSYYTEGIAELLKRYPEASGLHLDYFRYPYYLPIKPSSAVKCGVDFGYGKESIARFCAESNIEAPFETLDGKKCPKDYDTALLWDAWRREQLDRYLKSFRNLLSPEQRLSVAAVAWPERAYMTAYQNWQKWLREDLVDAVLPMIYTADHEMFLNLCLQARAFQGEKSRVIPGVGAYLFTKEASFKKQVGFITECEGIDEYCLFSYRNIRDRGWKY